MNQEQEGSNGGGKKSPFMKLAPIGVTNALLRV